jgi:CRP/FNR family cyclic AMP-dependent transcriptional regulator
MARRTKAEKVAVLSQVPLFSGLSKRQLNAVATVATFVSFAPGDVLVREFREGRRILIVEQGTAKVVRKGAGRKAATGALSPGTERRLATIGAGEIIGELSIIDGSLTSASVIAETPVEALVVGRSEFLKLFDKIPQLCRRLMAGLAARVRSSDHRADLIG